MRRLCLAIKANQPQEPVRYGLMNAVGNRNRNLDEKRTWHERFVIGFMRFALPPQKDNEQAAEFLRTSIGQNDSDIEWVAVRPDRLLNEEAVSEYV